MCGHKYTHRGHYIVKKKKKKKDKTNGTNWTVTHDNQGQTKHRRWLQYMPRPMQLIHRSAGAGGRGAVSHEVTKLNHHSTTNRGYDLKHTHKKRICYLQLSHVGLASAELLPLYFVSIPVNVGVCVYAHTKWLLDVFKSC